MHIPVLFEEVMQALQPQAGGRYLDATLGGSGHTEGVLQRCGPDGRVLGTDADANAIAAGQSKLAAYGERAVLRQAWLDETPALVSQLGFAPLNGALIDLGLSSNQLDNSERGFSFMREGPLDMRFDQTRGQSAAELIEQLDVEGLSMILREYGEVANARRVAEAIWAARPLRTTAALREVVAGVARSHRQTRIHPATQVFQALRIAVNDELRRVSETLPKLIGLLAATSRATSPANGRLAVITFHSLEDRIVKNVFRAEAQSIEATPGFGDNQVTRAARVRLVSKEPIVASEAEVAANPRARSAKLRVVERLAGAVADAEERDGNH